MGAQTGDRPVFVCLEQPVAAQELAAHLREHGLRTQAFADAGALATAYNDEPPAALIASLGVATVISRKQTATDELIVATSDYRLTTYLAAVRAGASQVITTPINRSALRQRLRWRVQDRARAPRLALVGAPEGVHLDGYDIRALAIGDDLLARLEDLQPDLVLLDADTLSVSAGELAAVIRQRPALRLPPVLAFTRQRPRQLHIGEMRQSQLDDILVLSETSDPTTEIAAHLVRRRGLLEGWRLLARRDPDTGLHRREELLQALTGLLEAPGTGTACLLHLQLTPRETITPDDENTMVAAAQILLDRLPPLAVPARLDRGRLAALLVGISREEADVLAECLQDDLTRQVHVRTGFAIEARTINPGGDRLEDLLQPTSDTAADTAPVLRDYWREMAADALEQNRFRLLYQPISGLHGRPCGFYEVFVRLIGSDGEELPPAEFLPALAGTSLAAALDRWVFGRALHVLSQRQKESADRPTLFVKLSTDGLNDDSFPAWLGQALAHEGVAASQLVVEIAAEALSTRTTRAVGERIAAQGIAVALEHVADAAALAGLIDAELPVTYVKPAPELTAADAAPEAHKALEDVASIARQAGLRLIATRIQDALSLTHLWQVGVDYVQGHFMQRPEDLFNAGPGVPPRRNQPVR